VDRVLYLSVVIMQNMSIFERYDEVACGLQLVHVCKPKATGPRVCIREIADVCLSRPQGYRPKEDQRLRLLFSALKLFKPRACGESSTSGFGHSFSEIGMILLSIKANPSDVGENPFL
jgi:hypothetical protein